MSTSAVSSASIFQELQSFYKTRQADLKQIATDLQSGDLADAQQAYQSLAALGQDGPFANSEPFSKSSRVDAFNALGQALQAGDLSQAQAALATLVGSQSSSSATDTAAATVSLTSTQATTQTSTQDASSIYQQLQTYRQERKADIAQLGQDLQAGNLTAAQQDYAALTALGESGPNSQGQVFQDSTRNQDFQAIGQALQSGDLSGAQSAFASLESTFSKQSQQSQNAVSAYNSGVAEIVINLPSDTSATTSTTASSTQSSAVQTSSSNSTEASSGAEIVINLGSSSGSSSSSGTASSEVTINLDQSGDSSGSPEQVEIDIGSNGSGAAVSIGSSNAQSTSTPAVTIDLQQQQNYQLVLNFLNSNAASQVAASSSSVLSLSA